MVVKKAVKAKVEKVIPEVKLEVKATKKEPAESELAQEAFAKKIAEAIKSFVCANPQSPGNNGCGNTVGLESANGEIVCSKCGWTQPKKEA